MGGFQKTNDAEEESRRKVKDDTSPLDLLPDGPRRHPLFFCLYGDGDVAAPKRMRLQPRRVIVARMQSIMVCGEWMGERSGGKSEGENQEMPLRGPIAAHAPNNHFGDRQTQMMHGRTARCGTPKLRAPERRKKKKKHLQPESNPSMGWAAL